MAGGLMTRQVVPVVLGRLPPAALAGRIPGPAVTVAPPARSREIAGRNISARPVAHGTESGFTRPLSGRLGRASRLPDERRMLTFPLVRAIRMDSDGSTDL